MYFLNTIKQTGILYKTYKFKIDSFLKKQFRFYFFYKSCKIFIHVDIYIHAYINFQRP